MQKHFKAIFYCFFLCIAIGQTATAISESFVTIGRVVDDQGRPVEGAEIKVVPGSNREVFSDSRGQFKITWNHAPWQKKDSFSCIIARYKAKNLGLALPIDNKAGTLHLTLKPAVSLSGSVVDTKGKSISGVRLSVMFRTPDWAKAIERQRQADGNSVFQFDAIPMENLYRFRAEADGYGQKVMDFDAGDAVNNHLDLGRIELPLADMSVSGHIVDIQGHPVPGMEVFCFGEGQPSCNTFSDEKGYFELNGVCAGLVRFMAEGRVQNKRFSRQVVTEAGARDVKVIVIDGGYSRSYYVRTKSHEDIINSEGPFIAGRVVDENGGAIEGVPVNVRCMKSQNEAGEGFISYFSQIKFGDVTDQQGRFTIELEEEAIYSLLFSPVNHAALIVYDVVTSIRDLEVVLPGGGTIAGRLVHLSLGKKVPIPGANVELKQTSRLSYRHLGFDRDRKTITDSEGRFRFEHIRTLMRKDPFHPELGPRFWELRFDGIKQTVQFLPRETTKNVDLVVRPNLKAATSLTGRSLPDYTGINIDLDQDRFRGKRLLICFFDYAQRPARHCILELNNRFAQLREQDIEVVAVQASKTKEEELDQRIKKMNISIPVGSVTGDMDETRFIWNVQSLPWLILTDREHKVGAEGFALGELDDKLKAN